MEYKARAIKFAISFLASSVISELHSQKGGRLERRGVNKSDNIE